MTENRMLKEALEAAQLGQRERARDLFTRLLRNDQDNPTYWVYLSALVNSPKERLYCLQTALQLDPHNDTAKRGLVLLGAQPLDENIKSAIPVRQRQFDIGEIGVPPEQTAHQVDGPARIPFGRLVALVLTGVIALSLIAFGIFGNPFAASADLHAAATWTPRPLGSPGPTATYLALNTSGSPIAGTQQVILSGPTPLSLIPEQSYTPTPRYVDTPHPSNGAYDSGMRAFNRQDWEDAITFFEQAVTQEPEAGDIRYHLGQAFMRLGEYLKAKGAFNDAVAVDPDFGPGYLGQARAQLGLNPDAIIFEELDAAIASDPAFAEAYLDRAAYRLNRNNPKGALQDIDQAEALSPSSARLHLLKAQALIALERYEEALEAALLSRQLDVTIAHTYLVLGEAYLHNTLPLEAIPPLLAYLQVEEQSALGWYLLGQAYFDTQFYENAIYVLGRAFSLEKTLYEVHYYRGASYLELGDYENALSDLDAAKRIFPKWFEAKLDYGRSLLQSGETADGYFEINASNSLAKTDAQKAQFYYWRALALEALDESAAARKDWNALLDLPPDAVPPEWAETARAYLSATPSPTNTPTASPTQTATPTITRSPSSTATRTKTPTPTPRP